MSQAAELMQKRSNFKPVKHPETPYNRAREEWNDRIGGLVKDKLAWKLIAFASLAAVGAMGAALVWKSTQSTIQPYYIRIAENGQPTLIGSVPERYTPQFAEVRYSLTEWINWTRAVTLDPVLVKQGYGRALTRMRQASANRLNDWAQKEPRLQAVGRETVAVQVLGVVPIGNTNSWQARWTEETRGAEGGVKDRQTWIGTFNLEFEMPTNPKLLDANPIGLYIKDFQWAREN